MNIYELKKFRDQLFKEVSNETSVTENDFIDYSLDILLDSKLIDNKSNNEIFISSFIQETKGKRKFKINSYIRNETGERLQLFVVDEAGLFAVDNDSILQSTQEYYSNVFSLGENFIKFAFQKKLSDIPESGGINALVNYMSSSEGMNSIDAIDLFLISPTITYQKSGSGENLKNFDFSDVLIPIKYSRLKPGSKTVYDSYSKEIPIYRHLININYLYTNYLVSGNRTQLIVNFDELGFPNIKIIEAVNEEKFESYIAVLPAELLTKLYQKYSFRLLEKNVRSFLQFKRGGPNSGMRETLQKEPEKFIAYNNGLTITATDKTIDENGYVKTLSDFQIVNGGQTTASIYFSKKDGIDVSKVYVTAKVNIAKKSSDDELEDLISNISKFSNSQTKVSIVDLRSRNSQLGKIKILSESILTPSSRKWFFEKSRGEFSTMLRMNSNRKNIEKQYPRDRRLSKEQLGKYYSAWGGTPHLIKKGGEAVFKIFVEDIEGKDINRDFYEDLIGRVLFFTELEKIHGTRDKAISQIRSAIIPYTISIIYEYTDKSKGDDFNFFKIWKDEGLSERARAYFYELMVLVLKAIKENATSDDLSEHSKKEELWKKVFQSKLLNDFMTSDNSRIILGEYGIKKSDKKKLLNSKKSNKIVDFSNIKRECYLFDLGRDFFKSLSINYYKILTKADEFKIESIINAINKIESINEKTLNDFEIIRNKITLQDSETFDNIIGSLIQQDNKYIDSVEWIIKVYNECIIKDLSIEDRFKFYENLAKSKNHKYTSVFSEISKSLKEGVSPTIKQINYISSYINDLRGNN